jgi:hypothetical protein
VIIDAHAHAARDYATVKSILETARKYEIENIFLCTSPKNNQELRDPPNLPVKKTPNSILFLNRMLRLAYNSFMKDIIFKTRNLEIAALVGSASALNTLSMSTSHNICK